MSGIGDLKHETLIAPQYLVKAARDAMGGKDFDLDPAGTEESNAVVRAKEWHPWEEGIEMDWLSGFERVFVCPPHPLGMAAEKLAENLIIAHDTYCMKQAIWISPEIHDMAFGNLLLDRAAAICLLADRPVYYRPDVYACFRSIAIYFENYPPRGNPSDVNTGPFMQAFQDIGSCWSR